jgi:hypothetical protein
MKYLYPGVFRYFGMERCYLHIRNEDLIDNESLLYVYLNKTGEIKFYISKYKYYKLIKGIEFYNDFKYIIDSQISWLYEDNFTIILIDKDTNPNVNTTNPNNTIPNSNSYYLKNTNELMETKDDYLDEIVETDIYVYRYINTNHISKIIIKEVNDTNMYNEVIVNR